MAPETREWLARLDRLTKHARSLVAKGHNPQWVVIELSHRSVEPPDQYDFLRICTDLLLPLRRGSTLDSVGFDAQMEVFMFASAVLRRKLDER